MSLSLGLNPLAAQANELVDVPLEGIRVRITEMTANVRQEARSIAVELLTLLRRQSKKVGLHSVSTSLHF